MNIAQTIPLSTQAIEILERLKLITGQSKYIFASLVKTDKPISENGMLSVIYRMGYKGKATVHGFRGTYSTIANDSEQHKEKINIEKIKKIYVSTKDLIHQQETQYLLPYCTLPTTKENSGQIRTTENFRYFCHKDINKVLRAVFPDYLETVNNPEPDRIYKNGYLVDETETSKEPTQLNNANSKSKEELIQYLILNGLNL